MTALDLKPVYHGVYELLAIMQRFAEDVMSATSTLTA